jgi:outer membrane protein OmpA-like peptidoglycan-associated protein
MKKLMSSTAVLSVVLAGVNPWPLMAQELNASGQLLAVDGSVICEPTADQACDLTDPALLALYAETQASLGADAEAQAALATLATIDENAAKEAEKAVAKASVEAKIKADAEAQAATDADAQAKADADAQAAADAAAADAQAKADAEAQAAADAAAADAQAKADADAQAAADAEAAQAATDAQAQEDAKAAADAQAKTDADAQAAADAAAAQAAADAQAQADADAKAAADAAAAAADTATTDADAQAKADAEAKAALDAQAEADAKAAADAAAATDAQAATDADAQAKADADALAAADAQAKADADAKAAADAAAATDAQPAADAQAQADAAVAEPTAEELAAQAAALAAAQAELAVQADGTIKDPNAGLKTAADNTDPAAAPVDAPVVSEAEVQTLSTLLAEPAADAPAATTEAAAAAEVTPAGEKPADAAPSADAVATTTEVVTKDNTRTSADEFQAAPVVVSEGKKNKLSNLEKVGLVALGALAVGAIIKNSRDNAAAQQSQVVSNTGDRVVVLNPDGGYQVYKDDDAVLRQPGSKVRTETFRDGSTRTIVERENGDQVVTIRDATGRVLRRATYDTQGREVVLFNDLQPETRVVVSQLPKPRRNQVVISTQDENADLKRALAAKEIQGLGRSFSLRQIREIPQVRHLAATIDVDLITFDSGSAALKASEAGDLADLGSLMSDMLERNPAEVFLIEGHTDATGKAAMNLALSDRRAETVALALSEYFDIPPENMVIQGYGESELRIDTQESESRNRRVAVRIITPLLGTY